MTVLALLQLVELPLALVAVVAILVFSVRVDAYRASTDRRRAFWLSTALVFVPSGLMLLHVFAMLVVFGDPDRRLLAIPAFGAVFVFAQMPGAMKALYLEQFPGRYTGPNVRELVTGDEGVRRATGFVRLLLLILLSVIVYRLALRFFVLPS